MRTGWIVLGVVVAGCSSQPAGVPARLIAPLSTATVTQQRPTLRWSNGEGAPTVELCTDRSCKKPLAIDVVLGADGQSAVPVRPLPSGWVYWRVHSDGPAVATSATWQFWVGTASATTAVDSSGGAILDVNGDGYADLLVGAPYEGPGGAVHIYLGSATPSTDGWRGRQRIDIVGPDPAGAMFGTSVASAGDVNGDGYGDFLVGTFNSAVGTHAHLYLGSAAPDAAAWSGATAPARIDLTAPPLFQIRFPFFGESVAGAGDFNGDGYGDFVVGNADAAQFGAVHIYLGSARPDAAAWNAAGSPARIDVLSQGGFNKFGARVASAGDIDGDGRGDILIGGRSAEAAPPVYVLLGAPGTDPLQWNGTTAPRRLEIDCPDGSLDPVEMQPVLFGWTLSGAGDVNNDGYADFLVGASNANGSEGAAHLYLGSAAPTGEAWSDAALGQRIDLGAIDGPGNLLGEQLAGVGDVDGDGYADFVAGGFTPHVYFGSATPSALTWDGGSSARRADLVSPAGPHSDLAGPAFGTGDVNGDGYPDFLEIGTSGDGQTFFDLAYVYLGTAGAGAATWNGDSAPDRLALHDPTPVKPPQLAKSSHK